METQKASEQTDTEQKPLFTLIENGDLYTPDHAGVNSILIIDQRVGIVGNIDQDKLLATGLPCNLIDASGCFVLPGLIDPHEHLIGAGGEQGFASRMPEVPFESIIQSGITTVVGCLGSDTTSRTLPALFARVRQLNELGLSAFMYTGGFPVPTPTITGSVTNDIVMIDPIIGVGEVAIADHHATEPTVPELERLVSQALLGGMLSGKAGVTHFHTGRGPRRLQLLIQVLDGDTIPPKYVYPTHVNRDEKVLDQAIGLAKRGCFVDMDVVEGDLAKWLRYYQDHGGPASQLTISSDAHTVNATPEKLFAQLIACIRDEEMAIEAVFPYFTTNTANALNMKRKGRLEPDCDADLLIVDKSSFELIHVIAQGRQLVTSKELTVPETANT